MPLDPCDIPFSGEDISDGQFSNAVSSDSVSICEYMFSGMNHIIGYYEIFKVFIPKICWL